MICPECGFDCNNDSVNCPVCGYIFDQQNFSSSIKVSNAKSNKILKTCSLCGTTLSDASGVCPVCGATNEVKEHEILSDNEASEHAVNSKKEKATVKLQKKNSSSKAPVIIVVVFILLVVAVGSVIFINRVKKDELQETIISEEESVTESESSLEQGNADSEAESEEDVMYTSDNAEDDTVSNTYTIPNNVKDFYGVFCGAVEYETDAISIAENLAANSFMPKIVNARNWSNLGMGNYYMVTSGVYTTKQEADSAVIGIRRYYPDAYVMYSGTYVDSVPEEIIEDNRQDEGILRIEELKFTARTRELTYGDLVGYSSFELSAVRNGIYAYNGYVFQSRDWEEFYLNNFGWYFPDSNFQTQYMSQIEIKNARLIEKYEKEVFGGVYKFG